MPFPDGTWIAEVHNGVVTAQYLTLDQRRYNITPHEVFKSFLLEEIRLTMLGTSTLFPSESDPGWRTGLFKAKEDTARVRANANTNAQIVYQFGKEEVLVRYIPVLLLAPEVKHTDTLPSGIKATWIPIRLPKNGEVIDVWVREDVVDVQTTSEDDKPAAPAIPVEPTPETIVTPPALVPPTVEVEPPPNVAILLKAQRDSWQMLIGEANRELEPLLTEEHRIKNQIQKLRMKIAQYETNMKDIDIIEAVIKAGVAKLAS